MAVSTGSRIFLFIAIIIGLFFIGFAIANIYYYKQIADGRPVSRSTGNVMLWINVVLLILAFILTAWALYSIFVPPETKVVVAEYANRGVQYLQQEPYTQTVVQTAPNPAVTRQVITAQAPPTQYVVDTPQPTVTAVRPQQQGTMITSSRVVAAPTQYVTPVNTTTLVTNPNEIQVVG